MNAIGQLISKDLYSEKNFEGNQIELFSFVANELEKKGFTTSEYLPAIIERETKFPTGLSTVLFDVAIPHTDPDYILKPFVYILRTDSKTKFLQMGSVVADNKGVYPEFIFFLGFNKGEVQLEILQELMQLFNDEEKMKLLNDSNNFKNIEHILKELI